MTCDEERKTTELKGGDLFSGDLFNVCVCVCVYRANM
jgi:hypothetical protein